MSGGWMSAIKPHSNPGAKTLFQTRNFLRRTIGTDDLFVCVVQRVEGVEKLLLHGLLLGDKLNVVNQQYVDVTIALAKLEAFVHLNRGDQFVGERLTGHVHNPRGRIVSLNRVADGVHQVGFAETHAAV